MMLANAIAAHIVADWFLQNDWMAKNKSNPDHIAGHVHAGIHLICLWAICPQMHPSMAVLVAFIHWVIDLRTPLVWWSKLIKQTQKGEVVLHMAFWRDQCAHALVLIFACGWLSK